jgi:hypothetical protein
MDPSRPVLGDLSNSKPCTTTQTPHKAYLLNPEAPYSPATPPAYDLHPPPYYSRTYSAVPPSPSPYPGPNGFQAAFIPPIPMPPFTQLPPPVSRDTSKETVATVGSEKPVEVKVQPPTVHPAPKGRSKFNAKELEAAVRAVVEVNPYQQAHGQVKVTWEKAFETTRAQSFFLQSSLSTFRNKIDQLLKWHDVSLFLSLKLFLIFPRRIRSPTARFPTLSRTRLKSSPFPACSSSSATRNDWDERRQRRRKRKHWR